MINTLSSQVFIAVVVVFARESYETTCPYPVPPKHAVLSAQSYLDEFNFNGFQVYQRVVFICRVGYRQTKGAMWSICGVSGRWYPDTRHAGECSRELRTGEIECKGRFRCRKDLQCIDKKLRCDCKPDCRDGTDEIGCKNPKKFIFINPAGRKTSGVLTSPNYPLGYARNDFRCHFVFYTDPAYRVKLSFEDFSLRGKTKGKCLDYVKIIGIHKIYKKKLDSNAKDQKSIIHCGSRSFDAVISNSSQLEMFVRLTGAKNPPRRTKLKGYSLSWSVLSQSKATEIVQKVARRFEQEQAKPVVDSQAKRKTNNENMLTILLPVAISALLPVSMLLFLCYHVRAKQAKSAKEEQGKKEGTGDKTKDNEIAADETVVVGKVDDLNLPLMVMKEAADEGSNCVAMERETLLNKGSWDTSMNQARRIQEHRNTPSSKPAENLITSADFIVDGDCDSLDRNYRTKTEICDAGCRKSKRLSMTKCIDSEVARAEFERWTCNERGARFCDGNGEIDGRKYLDKSSRPQSKVSEEDNGEMTNKNKIVCSCFDCENRLSKIDRFVPLTCKFDTLDEICTKLDGSRPQIETRDQDVSEQGVMGPCANDRRDICRGTRRKEGRSRRTKSGRRRRKHEQKDRSTGNRTPEFDRVGKEGQNSLGGTKCQTSVPQITVEYCHQSCNVCLNGAQAVLDGRDWKQTDIMQAKNGAGSNRSNSSDSGTCTGSEAPTKWQRQAFFLPIHSRAKYLYETDSGSRESAYAESFEDCGHLCSCGRVYPQNYSNMPHGMDFNSYPPSQFSYGCYGYQDGASIMADDSNMCENSFGGGEFGYEHCSRRNYEIGLESSMVSTRDFCNNIENYSQTVGSFVCVETGGNFNESTIDNEGVCREQFFQNGRHSKESLVYADNRTAADLAYSMQSNSLACQCRACLNARVNDSFIFRNSLLSRNARSPWTHDCFSNDFGGNTETTRSSLT